MSVNEENNWLGNVTSRLLQINVFPFFASKEKKDFIYRAFGKGKGKIVTSGKDLPKLKVGILTIKECERKAVLDTFGLTYESRRRHDPYTYYVGDFSVSTKRKYRLYVVQSVARGQVEASNATSDLISRYKPDIVVCCGIAGGIKGEVSIGDVIIGDTILYYEPGKVIPGQILPNPTPYRADARLLDRCYNVPKWEGPRFDREGVKEVRPKRKVGVIATGDKTIASEEKLEELRTKLSYQIIGVETEGNGFSAAIWLSPRQVRGIVIRGVSDYAGEDKANPNWAEKQMWQDIASKSAAEFLKHFLYDDPLWEDSTEE